MADVIHKLNITKEAALDLCECLNLDGGSRRLLKLEVEEYITNMSSVGKLPWWGYFRCDYIDEDSGEPLKLFIYKGIKIGLMQC